MSYSTVETGVVTVIRTHTDYDTTNCLQGDSSAIKKGYERVVRVWYDSSSQSEVTLRAIKHTWRIRIDIYIPYRGDISEMETRFATERQKILDTLAKYPTLNGVSGVSRADILNGGAPEPLNERKGAYRGQRLFLEVDEITTPTRVA